MKNHFKIVSWIAALMIGLAIYADKRQVSADTGHEGAQRIEQGSYIDIRNVSISSTAGTSLFAASIKRPDGTCFNNTSSTIWIGTVTANVFGGQHTNIIQGYPVLSSSTFHLGGSETGVIYATCDTGVSACEMRCIDGLVR